MKNKILRLACLLLIIFVGSVFWGCFGEDTNPPNTDTPGEKKHTLNIEKNTEEAGSVTGIGDYKAGDSVTLTATENEGYVFIGWYNGESLLSSDLSYTFTMPAGNATYTAKWDKIHSEGLEFELQSGKYVITGYTGTDTIVVIPKKYKDIDVTEISVNAFLNCSSIEIVIVPDSVINIGSGAFSGCRSLTSITLPFIGANDEATGSSALFGYIFGIEPFNGSVAVQQYFAENSSSIVTYYIPSELKSVELIQGDIPFNAFSRVGIKNVTLNEGVSSIGEGAFVSCDKLESITIPDSVTSIGKYAFNGCSSLNNITIPKNLTIINDFVFWDCSSLTNITIPAGVTLIGERAFQGCSSLTSINIPDSVINIGLSAFESCSSLTSVTIGNGVTSIGWSAFYGCSSLTSITIPESVTSISTYAFSDCSLLETVYIERPSSSGVTTLGSKIKVKP